MMPEDLEFCRGEATPRNSRIFAHTGGDGVHYCLLDAAPPSTDVPVVMVVPASPDTAQLIVGDSLDEFLALGSVSGFFFLEQLVYDRASAIHFLFDWDAFVRHVYFDAAPPAGDVPALVRRRDTLAESSRTFGLRRWAEPEARLAVLQQRWASKMVLGGRGAD